MALDSVQRLICRCFDIDMHSIMISMITRFYKCVIQFHINASCAINRYRSIGLSYCHLYSIRFGFWWLRNVHRFYIRFHFEITNRCISIKFKIENLRISHRFHVFRIISRRTMVNLGLRSPFSHETVAYEKQNPNRMSSGWLIWNISRPLGVKLAIKYLWVDWITWLIDHQSIALSISQLLCSKLWTKIF